MTPIGASPTFHQPRRKGRGRGSPWANNGYDASAAGSDFATSTSAWQPSLAASSCVSRGNGQHYGGSFRGWGGGAGHSSRDSWKAWEANATHTVVDVSDAGAPIRAAVEAQNVTEAGVDVHSNSRAVHRSSNSVSSDARVVEALQVASVCGSAKARLIALRNSLSEDLVALLCEELKQKVPHAKLCKRLSTLGLADNLLEDVSCILEHDRWDCSRSGVHWLTEWLQYFDDWVRDTRAAHGEFWCPACLREFNCDWTLQQHLQSKDHNKKLRNRIWRFGSEGAELQNSILPPLRCPLPIAASPEPDLAEIEGAVKPSKKKNAAAEILAHGLAAVKTPSAIAKKHLLEYRDGLSADDRAAILQKIGLRRANDVPNVEALSNVFEERIYEWICQVGDPEWVYGEPTFSWLAGFYWHPESTQLEQGGAEHGPAYCHLCEVECHEYGKENVHLLSRRHAENMCRWVERKGATPIRQTCRRCPGCDDDTPQLLQEDTRNGSRWHHDGPPLDLNVTRPPGVPRPEVQEEEDPPVGFLSTHRVNAVCPSGDLGADESAGSQPLPLAASAISDDRARSLAKPDAVPYVAFVLEDVCNFASGHARGPRGAKIDTAALTQVQVTSSRLRIGPKERRGNPPVWGINLQEPLPSSDGLPWRSLAVPLVGKGVTAGAVFNFNVVVRRAGAEEEAELVSGFLKVVVPLAGSVALVTAQLGPAGRNSRNWAWMEVKQQVTDTVTLRDFVGTGQVDAWGGIAALRGSQRAFQLATEELMLSFLLHIPEEPVPAPMLVFFHGDLTREAASCPMPGLADFCNEYGPAEICCNPKKQSHIVRTMAVVTPSCPAVYWWFRHPAVHDSTAYVASMEAWFRRLHDWLAEELQVCLRPNGNQLETGVRLVGQSMGGYAALELARAMPEMVAAVGVGAPCFDACRLDWLAERLQNVPLWVLIGRQDSMCAFEEGVSLVLKLRDRGALCARLSSAGIKGHNEACLLLDKEWLYRWLIKPLG